jgi:hypothetical protein
MARKRIEIRQHEVDGVLTVDASGDPSLYTAEERAAAVAAFRAQLDADIAKAKAAHAAMRAKAGL